MRLATSLLGVLLTLPIVAACSSDDPAPTGPQPGAPLTATVAAQASANAFSPSTQQIARGGTVTWSFATRPHNVTFAAVAGVPADIPTTTSAEVARQFNTAGTFPYECTVHPGMTGNIVVQ